MGEIKAPELLSDKHELDDFDCGKLALNDWLKKRALKNQDQYSTTRVVCIEDNVIAYYSLVYGSVVREEMTRKIQRNAPEKIPVMILGRLAVDSNWQGKGIAKHLLKEALFKTLEASKIAAIRGVLVHAIDNEAKEFYTKYGFMECKIDLTLILPIEHIQAQL